MKVVVLTGAGISAESGLPTFRDADGLWEGHDPMTVATPEAFHADPDLVHRFYDERRAVLDRVEPNAAHLALARLEEQLGADLFLVTQNIDDLHERAGSPQVAHLHGRLMTTRCLDETCTYGVHDDAVPRDTPPTCPVCGGPLRPAVILFGEMLDPDARWTARRAVSGCDLLLAVGTSVDVSTAEALVRHAVDVGARTVTVDPAPAVSPMFDVHVPLPAQDVLPRLLRT